MNSFKFALGQEVVITISGERGVVKGRAEFDNDSHEPSYYVHYKAGDGRAVNNWQDESVLSPI